MPEHELSHYTGELILWPLEDGQQMKTVLPFGFQDADGFHWNVPPGATVDGASIPKPLWSIVGGPWDGKYRKAAVVHDWFCSVRTEDWKSVHLMFYRAMLVSQVSPTRAKVMYFAVYFFGPGWSKMDSENTRLAGAAGATKPSTEDKLFYVQHDNLTIDVSKVIERDGMTAFGWIVSNRVTVDPDTEIILQLDGLLDIVERHNPSLQSLEDAIRRALDFIPDAPSAPRTVSVGTLTEDV